MSMFNPFQNHLFSKERNDPNRPRLIPPNQPHTGVIMTPRLASGDDQSPPDAFGASGCE
jgi:hypothetical protein